MLRRKDTPVEEEKKPKLRKRAFKRFRRFMTVAGLGALAAYFFDPDRGKARRDTAKDRLGGAVGRAKLNGEQAPFSPEFDETPAPVAAGRKR
jgi:hypothetical protein